MSTTILLSPNPQQWQNLYCNSITIGASGSTGSIPISGNVVIDGGVQVNSNEFFGLVLNSTSTDASNELLIEKSNVAVSGFGHNDFSNETYMWSFLNEPIKFGPGNAESLRLAAAGIPLDDTAPNILALGGVAPTTLSYRDDIVSLTGAQTLSNKTISNLVSTGTTDSMLSSKIIRYYYTAATIGAVATTILASQPVPNNSSISVEVFANGFCTSGTNANASISINAFLTRVKNVSNVATASGFIDNVSTDSDVGLTTASITFTTSGPNYSIQVNGVATDTISWSGNITIFY